MSGDWRPPDAGDGGDDDTGGDQTTPLRGDQTTPLRGDQTTPLRGDGGGDTTGGDTTPMPDSSWPRGGAPSPAGGPPPGDAPPPPPSGPGSPGAGGAPPPPSWTSAPPPPPRPSGRPRGWSGGRMIPLRPLRLGEILDAAFRLYRATFVEVAVLVAITLGAFQTLAVLVQGPQPSVFDPQAFEATEATTLLVRSLAAAGIALVSQLFVYPLVRGGVTGIALEKDRGGDSSWQAGLRLSLRLAGRLLGLAFLLLGLGILGGLLVAAVIGLPIAVFASMDAPIVAVVWGLVSGLAALALALVVTAVIRLAVPVVVVEHVGAWTALKRSYALVRPQLLRIVGIVVLTIILLGVVSGALGALNVVFMLFGGAAGVVGAVIVTTLSLIVTVPLEANIALLLYVDARVRVEGLDVAVLTAELDRA